MIITKPKIEPWCKPKSELKTSNSYSVEIIIEEYTTTKGNNKPKRK